MRYIFSLFLVVGVFGLLTSPAFAAVIKLDSDFKSLNVGDVFIVELAANTENQTINALETQIIFPSDILEYISADDGKSVVSLWVQKPTYDGFSTVSLSGITPGGFSGKDTEFLTLKFKAIKEGQGNIENQNAKLLLHDGLGTEAVVTKQNLHITINNGESEIVVKTVDDEKPESFNPEIIQDVDLFEGKHTLIFTTKDKGSGIDHFEVKEGWLSRFKIVDSPYELKNQSLDKKIQVKAIDKAGNERVEIIYPQNWRPMNEHPGVIVSILILCVLALFILRMFQTGRRVK